MGRREPGGEKERELRSHRCGEEGGAPGLASDLDGERKKCNKSNQFKPNE